MKQLFNKKASYNFLLGEKFEAGVALSGDEIKSLRAGKASLADSYVIIRDGEALLINVHIGSYEKGAAALDTRRARKLLLHSREIEYLAGKLSGSNLVIIPTRLYFKRNYAKIEIALARGKKKYDKRDALKNKALTREAEAELRADKREDQKSGISDRESD